MTGMGVIGKINHHKSTLKWYIFLTYAKLYHTSIQSSDLTGYKVYLKSLKICDSIFTYNQGSLDTANPSFYLPFGSLDALGKLFLHGLVFQLQSLQLFLAGALLFRNGH